MNVSTICFQPRKGDLFVAPGFNPGRSSRVLARTDKSCQQGDGIDRIEIGCGQAIINNFGSNTMYVSSICFQPRRGDLFVALGFNPGYTSQRTKCAKGKSRSRFTCFGADG